MQWIKYILNERIISTNEKEKKDMIILKTITKMNDTMERKICIRIDCIYHKRKRIC